MPSPALPPPLTRCVVKGFTLAELLIALTVLAVIATFTIPKVLYSNQQQQWNVKTKEAITSVSGAYQTCIADRGLNNCNGLGPIFDYLNVTSYTGLADAGFNGLNPACGTGAFFCYKLPSGVVFWWRNNGVDFLFADTTSTSAINLYIDPDSQNIGNSGSPRFYLYRDGFLSTPTTTRGGPSAGPSSEAPWFSWN